MATPKMRESTQNMRAAIRSRCSSSTGVFPSQTTPASLSLPGLRKTLVRRTGSMVDGGSLSIAAGGGEVQYIPRSSQSQMRMSGGTPDALAMGPLRWAGLGDSQGDWPRSTPPAPADWPLIPLAPPPPAAATLDPYAAPEPDPTFVPDPGSMSGPRPKSSGLDPISEAGFDPGDAAGPDPSAEAARVPRVPGREAFGDESLRLLPALEVEGGAEGGANDSLLLPGVPWDVERQHMLWAQSSAHSPGLAAGGDGGEEEAVEGPGTGRLMSLPGACLRDSMPREDPSQATPPQRPASSK